MSTVVLDTATGEKIPLALSKKEVVKLVNSLDDNSKDAILIKMLDIRKVSEMFEKEIKAYIKTQNITDGLWKSFKVSQSYRYSFDKERFLRECTEDERAVYDKMQEIELRYQKAIVSTIIK